MTQTPTSRSEEPFSPLTESLLSLRDALFLDVRFSSITSCRREEPTDCRSLDEWCKSTGSPSGSQRPVFVMVTWLDSVLSHIVSWTQLVPHTWPVTCSHTCPQDIISLRLWRGKGQRPVDLSSLVPVFRLYLSSFFISCYITDVSFTVNNVTVVLEKVYSQTTRAIVQHPETLVFSFSSSVWTQLQSETTTPETEALRWRTPSLSSWTCGRHLLGSGGSSSRRVGAPPPCFNSTTEWRWKERADREKHWTQHEDRKPTSSSLV